MPATHLFVSLKNRLAIPLLAAIALAAVTFSFIPTQTASACPGPPPAPLRVLYIGSARIVVARAGQTAVLQVEEDEDSEYKTYKMRTSFDVSSTLKGDGEEPIVHVYYEDWADAPPVNENYAEGKTLLLFLNMREGGDGYEVFEPQYGAKQLSEDALKIYVKRIEELAGIMRQKKPDMEKIVEWLVRCAEEPATRWEGAYELYYSNMMLQAELEKKAEVEKAKEAAAQNSGEVESAAQISEEQIVRLQEFSLFRFNPEFARLLTPAQKDRLATALVTTETIGEAGDSMLIDLVQEWDDARLVPFLIAQLNKFTQEPPYFVEELLTTLAEELDDEGLTSLAEKYSENSMYRDDPVEAEASSDGDEKPAEVDEYEKSLTGNAAQKRAARLQRFLSQLETVMNNQIALQSQ